tara:strand:+ start:637 stop:2301 length:1665 start_codon:yes stop_codon:yes gene_type:complete
MSIRRYTASADTTIVNAYKANLTTRGTGSNMGRADVMEVFSIYGRQQPSSSAQLSGSQELSRLLVQFPITRVAADRNAGKIPASGSISFYLKLYNAKTSKTVPRDYKLVVLPVSQSWQEGNGLDLENYRDETKDKMGANWLNAGSSSSGVSTWENIAGAASVGGSYKTGSWQGSGVTATMKQFIYTQTFDGGLEDLEVDITGLVEEWVAAETGSATAGIDNYGVGVHLSSSYEAYFKTITGVNSASIIQNTDGALSSYYTKRFFARGTQYFFKRPTIEARWNSIKRDDRANFYYSSSLAPSGQNLNTLYLYNYVRGRLVDIPGLKGNKLLVSFYSGSEDNSDATGSAVLLYGATMGSGGKYAVTASKAATGIYSCSVAITASSTPLKILFDVWHSGANTPADGSTQFVTASFRPNTFGGQTNTREPIYYCNITNLQNSYLPTQNARFNLYIREKNWNPTIYTKANSDPATTSIASASYRVYRVMDSYNAVPYYTGSEYATGLSYDVSGNYFDFDMTLLDPGYAYAFKFAFYDPELKSWQEQDQTFKFRVENYEY